MGRLILLVLIVVTIVLLWQAFAPQHLRFGSGGARRNDATPPAPKGPDDDPDFLWNIKKERFKEQRRREQEQQKEQRKKPPAKDPDEEDPGDTAS